MSEGRTAVRPMAPIAPAAVHRANFFCARHLLLAHSVSRSGFDRNHPAPLPTVHCTVGHHLPESDSRYRHPLISQATRTDCLFDQDFAFSQTCAVATSHRTSEYYMLYVCSLSTCKGWEAVQAFQLLQSASTQSWDCKIKTCPCITQYGITSWLRAVGHAWHRCTYLAIDSGIKTARLSGLDVADLLVLSGSFAFFAWVESW